MHDGGIGMFAAERMKKALKSTLFDIEFCHALYAKHVYFACVHNERVVHHVLHFSLQVQLQKLL